MTKDPCLTGESHRIRGPSPLVCVTAARGGQGLLHSWNGVALLGGGSTSYDVSRPYADIRNKACPVPPRSPGQQRGCGLEHGKEVLSETRRGKVHFVSSLPRGSIRSWFSLTTMMWFAAEFMLDEKLRLQQSDLRGKDGEREGTLRGFCDTGVTPQINEESSVLRK